MKWRWCIRHDFRLRSVREIYMNKFFALAGVAGLLFLLPGRADAASCCDQMKSGTHDMAGMHDMKAGCCDMPCCTDKVAAVDGSAIDMLLGSNLETTLDPLANQQTQVWFQRPVRIGNTILQGRYVIEHDNDRMARGEPCSYIYAFNDRTKPVVTFHCTHLERGAVSTNTVVLYSTGDGGIQKMSEFQFIGETAAHGVPIR
jgi:hypothetical protein